MDGDARSAAGFRFRKFERIRTRRDMTRVFDEGTRWTTRGMRLNLRPNGGAVTRAVFVTVRKYGNAVARNRARRVVSECWRLGKHKVASGYDVVVVIYPGEDTFVSRNEQLGFLLRRASLLVRAS